jgi:hypothetical protein
MVAFTSPLPPQPDDEPTEPQAASTRADAQPAAASVNPYSALYSQLQSDANIPNASVEIIEQSRAVFQGMFLDLAVIKQKITDSGINPPVVTIYADVLSIPDNLKWSLDGEGLVVDARRLEVGASVQIFLDYRKSESARFVLFSSEIVGTLNVLAVIAGKAAPVVFFFSAPMETPGLMIGWKAQAPAISNLTQANGLSLPVTDLFTLALDNSFIFGSLLYEQNPALALDIFTWVKNWSAESSDLLGLFLRSSSLVALLSSQINAQANGAAFVPYLTADVYTKLAQSFVAEAQQYESDYMQLSTQDVLTKENIELAKTLLDNAQYQSDYVSGLKKQAQSNYDNATAAVATAQKNLREQQNATNLVKIDFEEVGLPEYERKKIAEAVFGLVTAIVTFGAAIGAMALGQEEAAPAAAAGAADAAEGIATAAKTAADVAKMAKDTADQMKNLKKIVEALKKVYEFSQAVIEAASNIQSAKSMVSNMQSMDVDTGGVDVSASDQWAIFKLKTDAVLQVPVDAGIGYAADYKQALDILIIYGQSLAAAQVAAVRAGQELARVLLQQQLAQDQQQRLQQYVNSLKAGEQPIAAMMQQFYQRYLDSKSSLLAALENYRASYFYWALAPSSVRPTIIDKVNKIETGLQSLAAITLDTQTALSSFIPAPTTMTNKECQVDDPDVISSLRANNTASWIISLDDDAFLELDRVRVSTVRVWLEGAEMAYNKTISILISTSGSYRDRLNGTNYQFTARPLTRGFEYHLGPATGGKPNPAWQFDDGEFGYIEMDGSVAAEVSYAYFEPTPFTDWTITIRPADNPGLDLSKVTKITMQFQGSAIYTSDASMSASAA